MGGITQAADQPERIGGILAQLVKGRAIVVADQTIDLIAQRRTSVPSAERPITTPSEKLSWPIERTETPARLAMSIMAGRPMMR